VWKLLLYYAILDFCRKRLITSQLSGNPVSVLLQLTQYRQFKPAKATIGAQITKDEKLNVTWIKLKSAQVKEPWYIRYAHSTYRSKANLANVLGDKALPFQTVPPDPASEQP